MTVALQKALVVKAAFIWFNPKQASLPSTSEALTLNVARAHMQVAIWWH